MRRKKNERDDDKRLRLDELLDEDNFDEEDEDSVTDDTLEFLILDDETIASYQKDNVEDDEDYADDEDYEDEAAEDDDDYEDGAFGEEDNDYEDGDYEDDDYDDDFEAVEPDDDYEDEDEDAYDDAKGGIIARFADFIADMSTLDVVVAVFGILVVAGAIASGILFANAKSVNKQVEAFAAVGQQIDGVSVIGESGLLAVSESARLAAMVDLETEEQETAEDDAEEETTTEVTLNVTSIQSDMKIKFVNKSTGKLIGGVPFEVSVSGPKSYDLKDDDKDGIIYQTDVAAGSYQVKAKPFADGSYEEYELPTAAVSVSVSDTIAYKKVDVADEIKSESEINAAKEDTAVQDTVQEATLPDTVEWVESTRTPIEGESGFREIGKGSIPAPDSARAATGFYKAVDTGIMPTSLPAPASECTCSEKCADQDAGDASGCAVCEENYENCSPKSSEPDEDAECNCDTKCRDGSVNESCPVCKNGDLSQCKGAEPQCNCDNKCTSDNYKSDCPVCGSGDVSGCKGKEQEPAPVTYKVTKLDCPATLTVGATGQASAATDPAGGSISWSSSSDGIVSVDGSGKLTAKAVGEAVIKASCGDSSKEATVKVEAAPVKYTGITISGAKTVKVGASETLSGKTSPEGGSISWSSSKDAVLSITGSTGNSVTVKGLQEGEATITAVCGDAKAEWKVTVSGQADGAKPLKDKNGNQVYIKNGDQFVEAKNADYYNNEVFYVKSESYRYTGWQTIDGGVYYYDKNGNYVTGEQVIQGVKYTFGSDGRMASGNGTIGIDVSKWNGNIDWEAVRNSGVSYVIIRCGYRGSSTGALVEDPKFKSNIKGAKAAGLKVGVYFFTQAVNEVEAVEEASMAVSLVSGYGLDYPIFLDVESSGGRADGIGADTRTAVCRAFCATVQASGYSAGVYANKTWFTQKMNVSSLTGYKIWLAQYASAPTYSASRYDMWQYSSKGTVSGISGNVDMNLSYLSY